MKKIVFILFIISFVILSCKNEIVEKPKNLIDKDKMKEIIYDLAILEAAINQGSATQKYPKASVFLKEKYKVDSLTFAQNTQYYASDIKEYKKMYEEVKERLDKENKKLSGAPIPVQNLEEGIVK
jgi:hypothetical protein